MSTDQPITLSRDCEGILIPSGDEVRLPAGTEISVIQTLGGNYTVVVDSGQMLRIAAKDVDALGIAPASARGSAAAASAPVDLEEAVWDELRTCFDPEIPVNMVDLGLVYLCRVTPLPDGENKVEVKFTLTAPGCGMGDVLKSDVETKLSSIPGVQELDVEVVLGPPWDPSRMSEAAKLQLGMM